MRIPNIKCDRCGKVVEITSVADLAEIEQTWFQTPLHDICPDCRAFVDEDAIADTVGEMIDRYRTKHEIYDFCGLVDGEKAEVKTDFDFDVVL